MDLQEIKNELNAFAKYVIKQSRSNLTRGKHNASSKLYKSLDYDLNVSKNSFSIEFLMEDYGQFQDQGVDGFKKKHNSKFSFKGRSSRGKFERSIAKWIKTRGIKGRDKKGRFISDKSLNYLIRRHILNNGIKPSMFFTKPFEKAFKQLPDELLEKFGLDIDNMLEHALKDLK